MDDDIFRNLTRQKGFGGEVILDMAIEKGSQEDAKKEKRKIVSTNASKSFSRVSSSGLKVIIER